MTKLGMLQVIKKQKITLTDGLHVTAWGYAHSLKPELSLDSDMVLEINVDKLQQRKANNTVHDTGGAR
jgi:hypothetical protein